MEIILENTKNKLDTVERLLDYLSCVLFNIGELLDVVYLSDTGTYILIKKEILVKRDHASHEELFFGAFGNLNRLLNCTKDYIKLKKTKEYKFSFLDTFEELESLISKTNFEKSFLLLLVKISNLEKEYEKLLPKVNDLVPNISVLKNCYANPMYLNTVFPIRDSEIEIFFESDLQLIKDRIKFYLTDLRAEIKSANTNQSTNGDSESGQPKHKNQIMALVIYYTETDFKPNKTQWFIAFNESNKYTHRLEQTYNSITKKKNRLPKLIKYESKVAEYLKDNRKALKAFQIELKESKLNL